MLGSAQQNLDDILVAATLLDRALAEDPDFARARAARIAILAEGVKWGMFRAEDMPEAEVNLQRALLDDPNDPVVHIGRALIELLKIGLLEEDGEAARGIHLDVALEAVENARRLAPRMFWVYMTKAGIQLELGRHEGALATAREAVRLDRYLPAVQGTLIDAYLATGDYDAAIEVSQRLVNLDSGGYWGRRSLAKSYWSRGQPQDLERAEKLFLELHAEWSNAPWVHENLRDLYRHGGQDEQAAEEEGHLREASP